MALSGEGEGGWHHDANSETWFTFEFDTQGRICIVTALGRRLCQLQIGKMDFVIGLLRHSLPAKYTVI